MTQDRPQKLRKAAQSLFLAPNGDMPDASRIFLSALAKYCGASRTPRSIGPVGVDTNATMMMVGRLEVWNYVNNLICIPDRDVPRMAIEQIERPTPDDNGE